MSGPPRRPPAFFIALLVAAPLLPPATVSFAAVRPGRAPAVSAPAPQEPRPASAPQEAPSLPAPAAEAGAELTPEQETQVRGLEARLKCPVCRTQSVLESTSFMAADMRAKIRELVAAGRTDSEILDYFVDRYGDYILLEPRKQGFGLSAYALPALAVLAGGAVIFLAIRRGRRGGGPVELAEPEAGPPPGDDADLARLEEELRRYTV